MRLLVLNKTQADKIRGYWKTHHTFEPVEVVANTWYLLNLDAIIAIYPQIQTAKFRDLRENVMWFVVGDGSNLDTHYQNYLANQQLAT